MAHAKLKTSTEYTQYEPDRAVGLDAAAAKLASVLARIEKALANTSAAAPAGGQPDLFCQENAQLKADKDQLAQALAQMKQRYAQLKLTTMTVADRLDQAIERMDSLAG